MSSSIFVKNLSRGLRPSSIMPRNEGLLISCNGMIGRDGVLSSLDQLTALPIAPMGVIGTDGENYTCILSHIASSDNEPVTGIDYASYWVQSGTDGVTWILGDSYSKGIDDGFPYPCQFVFTNIIIVCGKTDIFELESGVLKWKLTVPAGATWRALDFGEFIYMSNNKVSVTRDPSTKEYAISNQPIASAMCNYNGQVIIGGYCTKDYESPIIVYYTSKLYPIVIIEEIESPPAIIQSGELRTLLKHYTNGAIEEIESSSATITAGELRALLKYYTDGAIEELESSSATITAGELRALLKYYTDGAIEEIESSSAIIQSGELRDVVIHYENGEIEELESYSATIIGGTLE